MAIKDEISRLQQAKEDFKTKLIEKGVTVSDDELISDYPPKLDLIKGGATVTKPIDWVGTAVPNSGAYTDICFNLDLNKEQVNSILNRVTFIDASLIGQSGFGFYPIAAFLIDDITLALVMIKFSDTNINVSVVNLSSFEPTRDIFIGSEGWATADTGLPLGLLEEGSFTNNLNGLPVGTQNDLISSVFSSTLFTQVQGEQVTLEGDYDGSTLVLDELPKGGWSGTPVPNSGYVENVYFNTNLTKQDILNYANQLNLIVGEGYNYFIFCNDVATKNCFLMYDNIKNPTVCAIAWVADGNFTFVFDSDNISDTGLIGWNPIILESNGFVPLNEVLLDKLEIDESTNYDVGTQNNLLSSLISTTPFVETKPNTINVKALIEQKKIPLAIEVNVEEGIDTSDATATANEIRKGFTAYIASGKVEGAIEDYDGAFEILVVLPEEPEEPYVSLANAVLPTVLSNASEVVINNKAYIFGGKLGSTSTDYTSKIKCYDPASDTVSTMSSIANSKAAYNASAVAINNKAYIFGGYNCDYVQCYDPVSDTCEVLNGRLGYIFLYGTSAVAINNKAYIFGGRTPNGNVTTIKCYDPVSDTVSTMSKYLNTYSYLTDAVAINNKAYIFGGAETNTIQCYDPTNDIITTMNTTLEENMYGLSAVVINNKAYIFGGSVESYHKKIRCYDPASDTISTLDISLLENAYSSSAVEIDSKVYIFGGYYYNQVDKTETYYNTIQIVHNLD